MREVLVEQEEAARSLSKKSKASPIPPSEATFAEAASSTERTLDVDQLAAPERQPFAGGLPVSPRMPKKLLGLLSPSGSSTSSTPSFSTRRSSLTLSPVAVSRWPDGLPMSFLR